MEILVCLTCFTGGSVSVGVFHAFVTYHGVKWQRCEKVCDYVIKMQAKGG